MLRRNEDWLVDELFADATEAGADFLCAHFPRTYCDANRAAWEQDPKLFHETLPDGCESHTVKVRNGLGMIPRLLAPHVPVYRRRLPVSEISRRIETCWQPYHDVLQGWSDHIQATGKAGLLIDAHSMPAGGCTSRGGADFILGDCHGTSCSAHITACAEAFLKDRGWQVSRNAPYAGGYITRHYGTPERGCHALQVEISRNLYMTGRTLQKKLSFNNLRDTMTRLVEELVACVTHL